MRALIRRCGGGATTFGVGTTMLLFMMALLVLGASAHAQEPVRAWVGGRIFAEVDTSIFSDAVGGIGGGLRAGLDWRRLGLEFGVDRPVEHERVVIEEYAAAGGRVRSTRDTSTGPLVYGSRCVPDMPRSRTATVGRP